MIIVCWVRYLHKLQNTTHRALNLEERQSDARLPVLRRLEDQVVEGIPDFGVLSGVGVREICERKGKRVSVVAERVCKRGTRG